MKKKKLSLKALKLDNSMEIIDPDELLSCLGGQGSPSNDCVFNCYDYLDGSAHGSSYYAYVAEYYYDFSPDSGGLKTEYIDDLGNYGGMSVNELTGTGSLSIGSNGLLPNGDQIMMTFNSDGGADHAVVVTGAHLNSGGSAVIEYYDPTTGQPGERTSGDYSGLYGVGAVGSYP